MPYTKTTWVNGTTEVNETNMNNIESQLETLTNQNDGSALLSRFVYTFTISSGTEDVTRTISHSLGTEDVMIATTQDRASFASRIYDNDLLDIKILDNNTIEARYLNISGAAEDIDVRVVIIG